MMDGKTAPPPGASASPRVGGLRDFLDLLGKHGQCVRWTEPVLPEPDIRNITQAAGRDPLHGPAVLFEHVRGYPGLRVVNGVHGSFTNLALLLGKPEGTSVKELFYEMIGRWGCDRPQLEQVDPGAAPVCEVVIERDINLYAHIPLYRTNAYDGGFYLAKAAVVSRDPNDPEHFGKQNVGIYRIQIHGPDTLTLLSVPSHDMGRHIMAAEEQGKPLRIAIMLGNHPAIAMLAGTPIPYDESEYAYASQLMGAPLRLTRSGNGVDILADSEFVIEAELLPNQRAFEGPFGEFPGSYSGVRRVPLFRVTRLTHRRAPIFENLYIGGKWTEHDTLIGLNTSAPIYAALKKEFPEVEAVNALYQHGLTAIVAVRNRFAGFAKSVAMRALGTPHGLMYLKNLIMVDADVDPFDLNEVMWALSTRTRANDIIVIPNTAMIIIDPAAEVPGKGHHLIIDATSFMPPDPMGSDAKLVRPPSGPLIDEIARRLARLRQEANA